MKNYIKSRLIYPLIFLAGICGGIKLGNYIIDKTITEEATNISKPLNNLERCIQSNSFELSGVKINNDGTDPSITSKLSDEEYVRLEGEGKIIHNSLNLRCHDTVKLDGVKYLIWCNVDGTNYLIHFDEISPSQKDSK